MKKKKRKTVKKIKILIEGTVLNEKTGKLEPVKYYVKVKR
jgi:hypothetical protein